MGGRWLRRLEYVVQHWRGDADVRAEMGFHLDMKQREFEARGMSAAAGSTIATRAMGNLAGLLAVCIVACANIGICVWPRQRLAAERSISVSPSAILRFIAEMSFVLRSVLPGVGPFRARPSMRVSVCF